MQEAGVDDLNLVEERLCSAKKVAGPAITPTTAAVMPVRAGVVRVVPRLLDENQLSRPLSWANQRIVVTRSTPCVAGEQASGRAHGPVNAGQSSPAAVTRTLHRSADRRVTLSSS